MTGEFMSMGALSWHEILELGVMLMTASMEASKISGIPQAVYLHAFHTMTQGEDA